MAATQLSTMPMWRAGIETFKSHVKEWLPLAFVFFVLVAMGGGELHYLSAPVRAKIALLKKEQAPLPPLNQLVPPLLWAIGCVYFFVVALQRFLYLGFFMKKQTGFETKLSVWKFVRFVLVNIFYAVVIFVPMIAATFITVGTQHVAFGPAVGIACTVLGLVFFLILAVRFYISVPIAITTASRPIRQSWALTEGKFWRLFGNTLVIVFFIAIVYLPFILIGIISGYLIAILFHEPSDNLRIVFTFVINGVFSGAFSVFVAGITSAYESTVCRILLEEKRSINPAFSLVTSLSP